MMTLLTSLRTVMVAWFLCGLACLQSGIAWAASQTKTANSYDLGTNWTNPGNAAGASDNACAYYNNTSQDALVLYNYGFSIPSGATIDSINLTLDGHGASPTTVKRQVEVQLTKTGGTSNTPVGNLVENITLVYGPFACSQSGDSDVNGEGLWGATWAPSEINATGFGVIVKDDDGQSDNLGLDALSVTVYYTEAPAENYSGKYPRGIARGIGR